MCGEGVEMRFMIAGVVGLWIVCGVLEILIRQSDTEIASKRAVPTLIGQKRAGR